MKFMIASDIHGSAYYCRKLFERWEKEEADKLLLLGDLLYHGPRNDLPREYAPKEVIGLLNGHKQDILSVRGNCEAEVDQMVLEFPVLSDYAVVCGEAGSFFMTHGHIYNKENVSFLKPGDVLLYGHTHLYDFEKTDGGWYAVNPGSVSLAKENRPNTYMIYENGQFILKDMDGQELETYSAI